MEVSKEIIEKAFTLARGESSHAGLDILLQKLSDQVISDILDISTETQKIDSEIRSIWTNATHRGNHLGDKVAKNLAGIINSANKYLSKSVLEGDLRSLLVYLSVNCYLQADPDLFLRHLDLSDKSRILLSEKISGLLKSITFQTVVPTNAPYHEKELKSNAIEGFEQGNIEKVYQLILAVEHGERGFGFNFLLENLIQFLFRFDKKQFHAQLSTLTHPEEMVFYLQGFPREDLIEIAAHERQYNKWLLHELIRQIIKKEKKGESPNDSIKRCVSNCLHEIFQSDPVFYLNSAQFFQRSKLFNAALGSQLVNLEDDKIAEVITSALPIDKYNFNLEARDLLLEEFGKYASPEKLTALARAAYGNWITLYETLYRSNEYQNDLLVTDYANFVVQYLVTRGDVKELLKSALYKLRWINCEWFRDETEQVTRYNLYLTDAYLLSYAFKNKQIVDPEISDLVTELKRSQDFEIRAATRKSDSVAQIESNVNWGHAVV